MADETQALVPAEQASITFYGQTIRSVRLADGRIAAVFSDLCDALALDRASQARRVRSDEVLADQLLFAQVATDMGTQPMDVLTAWAIPTWLTGIQLSRLAPAKRPAILAFKREAADVLYRHFSHAPAAISTPSTLVPAEPIQKPTRPAEGSDALTMAQYYRDMAGWLEWQHDMEEWRGTVEDRLESVEEVARLVPEILERLGPETLTSGHHATLKAMVKRLHEMGGFAFQTINYDLAQSFHVRKVEDLPEAQWPEIVRWLQTRIDAAERQKH